MDGLTSPRIDCDRSHLHGRADASFTDIHPDVLAQADPAIDPETHYSLLSLVGRFGFEACVRIRVGGHVIVFGVRGDTVDEIIGDLVLALAVFVDAGGF
jgi:hypothetical protein